MGAHLASAAAAGVRCAQCAHPAAPEPTGGAMQQARETRAYLRHERPQRRRPQHVQTDAQRFKRWQRRPPRLVPANLSAFCSSACVPVPHQVSQCSCRYLWGGQDGQTSSCIHRRVNSRFIESACMLGPPYLPHRRWWCSSSCYRPRPARATRRSAPPPPAPTPWAAPRPRRRWRLKLCAQNTRKTTQSD